MNSNDYQKGARRTESVISDISATRSNGDKVVINSRQLHAILGLVTEAGELTDLIKKKLFYGKEFDEVKVIDELGDIAWYLAIGASACGMELGDVLIKNLQKLKVRYPEKFEDFLAINRNLAQEEEVFQPQKE